MANLWDKYGWCCNMPIIKVLIVGVFVRGRRFVITKSMAQKKFFISYSLS